MLIVLQVALDPVMEVGVAGARAAPALGAAAPQWPPEGTAAAMLIIIPRANKQTNRH